MDEDIVQGLFIKDSCYITSVTDASGERSEGVPVDPAIYEIVSAGNSYDSDKAIINDKEYYVCYLPILKEDGEIAGMAFAGTPREDVVNAIWKLNKKTFIVIITLLVVFSFVVVILAKMIIAPIKKIIAQTQRLAEGDLEEDGVSKLSNFSVRIDDTMRLFKKEQVVIE